MKFVVATLLTALLAFVGGLWFDWWCIAVAGLLIGMLVHQRAGKAFSSGFLAVFLLWGLLAWWIDMKNDSILSKKIAEMLHLGTNPALLILVTALVGGLVTGFGALTGSYVRGK